MEIKRGVPNAVDINTRIQGKFVGLLNKEAAKKGMTRALLLDSIIADYFKKNTAKRK